MWPYKSITREEFEKIKDHIEEIMIAHGAEVVDIKLPYTQKTTSLSGDFEITCDAKRRVFKYNNLYYRINGVCFPDKPFIVAEVGDYDELIKNIMEDASPFPYDLSEEEFDDEVSYFLEEKPYPEDY